MEYPFSVRDIIISDPFILADPVSKKYYTYAAVFNPERFPIEVPGVFYALESEDLVHWSNPIKVFDSDETGFCREAGLLGAGMSYVEGKILSDFFLPYGRKLQKVSVPGK